jgi:thymidylate kinase
VFFLDVPVRVSQKLLQKSGKSFDLNEAHLALQERVRRVFLSEAKKNKKWVVINCMKNGKLKSREEIARNVWFKAKKLFGVKNDEKKG